MADILQTVPFTFDEIYTSLVDKLGFDAPYEGSEIAQILTSMSYVISMLNVNTAANINEMLLPIATKRENILEGARLLGYESSKKTSYRYSLTLTLNNDIAYQDKVILGKYTKFTSGENSYYFMDSDSLEIYGTKGDTFTINVIEGELKHFNSEPVLTQIIKTSLNPVTNELEPRQYLDIPFPDVEENGIEVYLTYVDEFGNQKIDEEWTRTPQFMIEKDTLLKKEWLRKDDIDYRTPRIYFMYAGIGHAVKAGTIAKMTALVTKGALGAEQGEFTCEDSDISTACAITINELIAQGSNEEDVYNVRENAPIFFNTANRVITAQDYIAFCSRDSRVNKCLIWGGDEEYPQRPGHVFFSFIPTTFTRSFSSNVGNIEYTLNNKDDEVNLYLEDDEIESVSYDVDGAVINPGIWDTLADYKIPSLKYNNRHPSFLNCEYTIEVLKYKTTQTNAKTHEEIFTIIDDYYKGVELYDDVGNKADFVERFNFQYFNSNIIKRIDQYITDNSGFNISLKTDITLYDKNCIKEDYNYTDVELPKNMANIDIRFQLGVPLEGIFDTDGKLLYTRLPNINTTGFKCNGIAGSLYVDWDAVTGIQGNLIVNTVVEAPIKHNNGTTTTIIGKYMVFNGFKKYIEVRLFAADNTSDAWNAYYATMDVPTDMYLTSTLKRTDIQTTPRQKIDISFISPNFSVQKTLQPRLTKVTFI